IRNILYHVPAGGAFKFSAAPAGIYVLHNTLIGEQTAREGYSNTHWRNNLFLGRDMQGRGIMTWANATANYSTDYNAFRPNRAVKDQYGFLAPGAPLRQFATLADLRQATGQEAHGIEVDFDIFENLTPPDPDPGKRYRVYHAMDLNFRLKANAKPVDAGVLLPTINDDFVGKAPDLGALEVGKPDPHYGPRWITWAPFYR
ncbi:MAG: hypothetical protein JNL62_09625, partial [Bryobacterales bacterium]|nr:hypothetical protein [Bryobacterales bacterium]